MLPQTLSLGTAALTMTMAVMVSAAPQSASTDSSTVDVSTLPTCATQGAITALQLTGCDLSDVACICRSNAFITTMKSYAESHCTASERATVYQFARQTCSKAGVDLPADVTDDNPSTDNDGQNVVTPVDPDVTTGAGTSSAIDAGHGGGESSPSSTLMSSMYSTTSSATTPRYTNSTGWYGNVTATVGVPLPSSPSTMPAVAVVTGPTTASTPSSPTPTTTKALVNGAFSVSSVHLGSHIFLSAMVMMIPSSIQALFF